MRREWSCSALPVAILVPRDVAICRASVTDCRYTDRDLRAHGDLCAGRSTQTDGDPHTDHADADDSDRDGDADARSSADGDPGAHGHLRAADASHGDAHTHPEPSPYSHLEYHEFDAGVAVVADRRSRAGGRCADRFLDAQAQSKAGLGRQVVVVGD
jgi:hypothetical protein